MLRKNLAAVGGVCAVCCAQAEAGETGAGTASARAVPRPVVVEMFVSQACNQSPPAAEVLNALAARPDVVALTWHVDYWDDFPAPGVGAWKDPFARPDFSARQISYNKRIRGRAMKMTPQTVIDGVISVSGSNREAVEKRILEAQFLDEMARPTPPRVDIKDETGDIIRTRIDNVGAPYDAFVVNFKRKAVTKVRAGDNAGVTFREANVVHAVSRIADGHAGPGEFSFEAPPEGLDCAVIVQERGHGRIVAARYCGGDGQE